MQSRVIFTNNGSAATLINNEERIIMNKDKEIIQALLEIIDSYDNNDVAKQVPLFYHQERDETVVISLSTKGEANKGTPFYFGNMHTCILKEYWYKNKVVNADILYTLSEHSLLSGDNHED